MKHLLKQVRRGWLLAMLIAAGITQNVSAQTAAPASQGAAAISSDVYRTQDLLPAVVSQEGRGEEGPPPTVIGDTMPGMSGGCASCGGGGCRCYPGRYRECGCCNSNTCLGRMFGTLYEELCCPDPCYEGKWIAAANAAFFVEGTRPVTMTRIRYDAGFHFTELDRSEFFWARSGGGGRGPGKIEPQARTDELSLYTEIAAKGFSFFFEVPYLAVDSTVNPQGSGFGDMRIGTKSLLFDRDLLQVGFMFKTYLPVGKTSNGIGTGHVSLEPSLLATVKLGPDTYFESQLSEWIPIGGDQTYEGSVLHYHFSLNHVLYRPVHDVQLIGTLEFNGYSFQDGAFSDPVLGQFQKSSAGSWLSAGPGLRFVICDWLDFGFAAAFAFDHHGPEQFYRTEFRIRY